MTTAATTYTYTVKTLTSVIYVQGAEKTIRLDVVNDEALRVKLVEAAQNGGQVELTRAEVVYLWNNRRKKF